MVILYYCVAHVNPAPHMPIPNRHVNGQGRHRAPPAPQRPH